MVDRVLKWKRKRGKREKECFGNEIRKQGNIIDFGRKNSGWNKRGREKGKLSKVERNKKQIMTKQENKGALVNA